MAPSGIAEEIVNTAIDQPDRAVSLRGSTGAGKTSTAIELAGLARERNRLPILLSSPTSAPDAGPIMASVALGALDPEPATDRPLRYEEGLARLRQLLYERQDQVVVIADEPSAWIGEGSYFGRLGQSAYDVLVADSKWPTVVLDRSIHGKVDAVLDSMPTSDDLDAWGSLRDAATRVADFPEATAPKTPLDHKFLSALIAWGRVVPDRIPSTVDIAETLREVLSKRRSGPKLWRVWQRLALARTGLPYSLIDQLGADRLDDLSKDTLRHVLLDPGGRLHDVPRSLIYRKDIPNPISSAERLEVHRDLFQHHLEMATASEKVDDVRRHAAEALFHGGEAGEEDVADLISVTFVEQLNSLGRRLSKDHEDRMRAAGVFLTAIGIDEENAYAQHYRGFNLDFEGERAQEVAQRYDIAVGFRPGNPRWHARRVTFFADIGKLKAARKAWDAARTEAAAGVRGDRPDLYTWVGGALLHQGELTFATEVLSAVPAGMKSQAVDDLRLALQARFTAQDMGAVVPAPRSWRTWWSEGPTQLPLKDTQGRTLKRWSAGRVEQVGDEGVQLRIALIVSGSPPQYGRTLLTASRLEASLLDETPSGGLPVGQFIEMGEYEHSEEGRRIAIRLVRPDPHFQPAAPLMRLDRWRKSDGISELKAD